MANWPKHDLPIYRTNLLEIYYDIPSAACRRSGHHDRLILVMILKNIRRRDGERYGVIPRIFCGCESVHEQQR
jgi:hypothetical protein